MNDDYELLKIKEKKMAIVSHYVNIVVSLFASIVLLGLIIANCVSAVCTM